MPQPPAAMPCGRSPRPTKRTDFCYQMVKAAAIGRLPGCSPHCARRRLDWLSDALLAEWPALARLRPSVEGGPVVNYETITVTPVTAAIGAEVSGIDLGRPLGNQQFQEVHDAL